MSMNPAVLRILLLVLSGAVVVVRSLVEGHFDPAQLTDIVAGLLAGAAAVKRPGDKTPAQVAKAESAAAYEAANSAFGLKEEGDK